jgi:hypothetical protein
MALVLVSVPTKWSIVCVTKKKIDWQKKNESFSWKPKKSASSGAIERKLSKG